MSYSIFSSRDKANPSAFHLPLELSVPLTRFIAIPWTQPHLSVAPTCDQSHPISPRCAPALCVHRELSLG